MMTILVFSQIEPEPVSSLLWSYKSLNVAINAVILYDVKLKLTKEQCIDDIQTASCSKAPTRVTEFR